MKYRESGMPSEQIWSTFFNPNEVLGKMGINKQVNILIDIGCGYGTFLFPAAAVVSQAVGIDIDPEMIKVCREKLKNLSNVKLVLGDICREEISEIIGKYRGRADYITLFNLLHCEEPLVLLHKAYDFLMMNGKLGVIHWNYEKTPRGPSLDIRPRPQTIIDWATQAGFTLLKQLDLLPYHFGLVFKKGPVL